MADISLETVTGKLNRLGYDAFMRALRHAKKAGTSPPTIVRTSR
jgi:type VI secretion system protein VasG